jgi:hypothetical protein
MVDPKPARVSIADGLLATAGVGLLIYSITWQGLTPETFTVRKLSDRSQSFKRDPWNNIGSARQSLANAVKKQFSIVRT